MDWVLSFTGTAGLAHQRNVWGILVRLYNWPVISMYALSGYRVNLTMPFVPYIWSTSLQSTDLEPSGLSKSIWSTSMKVVGL